MVQVLDDNYSELPTVVEFAYTIENLHQRTALGQCDAVHGRTSTVLLVLCHSKHMVGSYFPTSSDLSTDIDYL